MRRTTKRNILVQATPTTRTDIITIIVLAVSIDITTVQVMNLVNTNIILVASTDIIVQAVSIDIITQVIVRTTLLDVIVLARKVRAKTKRKERNGIRRKRFLLEF